MEQEKNAVGWFEIPVTDMERAMKFYETVFGFEISRNQLGPLDMGWFPFAPQGMGAGGSLVKHEAYTPSTDGTLIYFTAPSGDLKNEVAKVEEAGGKILIPTKKISEDNEEFGYMAVVQDTEGNRIAIHSKHSA